MLRILAIVLLAYVFLYPRFANSEPISVMDSRSEQLRRVTAFDPLSAVARSLRSLAPFDDIGRKLKEAVDG